MPKIKEISVSELARMLCDENRFDLVDICTAAEIERGVLPKAKFLAMRLFSESPRPIVVYCRTGSRSAQVCRFLDQQGIHNVISMRGGIAKWTSSGHHLDRKPHEVIGRSGTDILLACLFPGAGI
jgi:rhodanese-related sulfurtransferase